MSEINPPQFDTRQCIAKDLDKTLAKKIEDGQLGAAQKLFSDCINTVALNMSALRQQEAAPNQAVSNGQPRESQSNEPDRYDGMAAVKGVMQLPQIQSEAIDDLKYRVQRDLKEANFPHPDYAQMLDGVQIDDK